MDENTPALGAELNDGLGTHPRRRLKSYDGVKAHYTAEQLDELEKRAREWSRMDQTDKLKLINMARYALRVEAERDEYKRRFLGSYSA